MHFFAHIQNLETVVAPEIPKKLNICPKNHSWMRYYYKSRRRWKPIEYWKKVTQTTQDLENVINNPQWKLN